MSQIEVWNAGGPSNSTLTKIENGQGGPVAAVTLRRLDTGLRWAPGTASAEQAGLPRPTPAKPAEQSRAERDERLGVLALFADLRVALAGGDLERAREAAEACAPRLLAVLGG